MRILHTGDWHLGRTLLGADLLGHQSTFADFLVETVRDRAVDLVVIAGDVYDRAIPPVDAVRLLSRTLERLAETATVVLTPGNHDSAARLGFGAGVMHDRVRILAEPTGIGTPVLLDDEYGPVAVYGIPYLHPDLTRYALADVPDEPLARSHQAVVGAGTARIRADLAERPGTRSVVVAHAFVGGAAPSDSEQDIRVGGVDQVAASVFDGIDYVALGHLHGPQRVGAGDRIRYAGSRSRSRSGNGSSARASPSSNWRPTVGSRWSWYPLPCPGAWSTSGRAWRRSSPARTARTPTPGSASRSPTPSTPSGSTPG